VLVIVAIASQWILIGLVVCVLIYLFITNYYRHTSVQLQVRVHVHVGVTICDRLFYDSAWRVWRGRRSSRTLQRWRVRVRGDAELVSVTDDSWIELSAIISSGPVLRVCVRTRAQMVTCAIALRRRTCFFTRTALCSIATRRRSFTSTTRRCGAVCVCVCVLCERDYAT
jgi:hypothetical protein